MKPETGPSRASIQRPRLALQTLPLIAALLFVAACLAFSFRQDTPVGSIHGKVFTKETSRLLPGVRIALQPAPNAAAASDDEEDRTITRRAVSGPDGSFSLAHVPAGDYVLSAVTRAHSISSVHLTVGEGGVTETRVALNRSQADLEVKVHQRIFGTRESPHLSVSGYADERKPAQTDVMRVRIWKTRLSSILKDPASAAALDRVGAAFDAVPRLPSAIMHPASGPAPSILLTREVTIKDDPEGFFYQTLDFGKLELAHVPTGLYLMDVSHQKSTVCAWLLVTDTALIVKRAKNKAIAFAVDMQTGAPLAGSILRAYRNGTVISERTADTRGIADLSVSTGSRAGEGTDSEEKKVTLVAMRGDDEAVVADNGFQNEQQNDYTVHTYTDRPIYRPGQHISFKTILRRQASNSPDTQARYAVPAGVTIEAEMRDPSGERVYQQSLRTNEYGSAASGIDIHPESPTGVYTIKLKVNGEESTHDVVIASYRKPEFSVAVTSDKKRYSQGDTVHMTISGQYFFGAPVAGAKVKYHVFSSPDYQSEYGSDEDASDAEPAYSGGRHHEYYGGSVTDGDARLDANGKAFITFSTSNPERPRFMQQAENYTVSVTVTEGENRQAEAEGTALITPGAFHLAVTPEGYVAAPGKPTAVVFSAKDWDRKPVGNLRAEVETGYQVWTKTGMTFKQTQLQQVTLGPDGRLSMEMTPPHAGEFIIKLRARDSENRKVVARGELYAAEDGGGDLNTEYADLSLLTDRRSYKTGDTARVLLNASRTGQTVLLTIEGEQLYLQQTVVMTQKSRVLYIPIKREYGPNVFLAACCVREKHFAQTSAPLRVATPQQDLHVQVTADRETSSNPKVNFNGDALAKYQPGDKITYHIQSTDAAGRPVPCELSFGVVDEAIYALKEDAPNALKDDFYPRRSNLVSTEFSFAIQYLGDADKSEPKIVTRKKFPDTAFWNPFLKTDAQGQATVSFLLPDTLTTWRATATGHTLDTKIGRTVQKVVSTKDFLVRLQTPRFLTQKDAAELVAFVHNETGKDQAATVSLNADGLTLKTAGVQTLQLKPGQIGEARWPVTADAYGAAKLTVKAWTAKDPTGAQFTDGLETSLPVRPHGREDVQGFAGQVMGARPESEVVRLDANAVPGLSRLTVRITPSISSALLGATEYLIGFPYGCTEQTMSRFLPDLLVQRALKQNGIQTVANAAELPAMVRTGLLRLTRYQHSETGAWGWWQHDEDNAWMTAYVLYGLATAKAEGYPVSDNVLSKGRKAAAKMAADVKTDLTDRAFLMVALALCGDKDTARKERNRPIPLKKFSAQALGYMVLLDRLLGTADVKVTGELNRRAKQSDNMVHWNTGDADQENWNDISTTAVALRALLAVDPHDIRVGRVLSWLMLHRSGEYWSSTRDTSQVLAAFCDYLSVQHTTSAGGAVQVRLNGAVYQTIALTPDLLKEKEVTIQIPSSALRADKNDVTLERTGGDSAVFYSVQLRQTIASEDLPALPKSPLSIRREYLRLSSKQAGSGYYSLQTEPTNNQLNAGENIRVRLTINAPRDLTYVLIEDAYPAGCDISERGDADDVTEWGYWYSSVDVRDDRIAFFARTLSKGAHVIEYNLRAQTPGDYHVMPTLAQGMYAPETHSETAEARISIH